MTDKNLTNYHLTKDAKRGDWKLEKAGADRATARFETKAAATKGGVLASAIGKPASVKIHKENGRIQEERTFPRGRDPRNSNG